RMKVTTDCRSFAANHACAIPPGLSFVATSLTLVASRDAVALGVSGRQGGSMTLLPAVLPRLRGFWLWAFRVVFAAAFVFALFAAGAATWYDSRPDSGKLAAWGSPLGLGVRISTPVGSAGWRVMRPFSAEALAARFHTGDEIVAINGHPGTHFDLVAR